MRLEISGDCPTNQPQMLHGGTGLQPHSHWQPPHFCWAVFAVLVRAREIVLVDFSLWLQVRVSPGKLHAQIWMFGAPSHRLTGESPVGVDTAFVGTFQWI